ncbi:ADP-ribosylglycohydrolase family protein [Phragmitibacter flavus]|uniref:ADP-ribosylglycohydrolase family protein n=1 Tax=Phragmitibacter flavus TaxID=2576071 RepID=A0A5R8KGR2_9BACT|nr:ADP-ribosylglycohydrolase family protein [Phragmitibacter flavus]TLD71155.1 ADP-ribosylglycohydrolase family protein [Phragmitibacter flavus]
MNPLLLSSLIADSIALGPHWIYDSAVIDQHFPNGLSGFENPRSSYHPGKKAGDQTHYGDQTLALVSSLQKRGDQWTLEGWREDWQTFWKTSTSYRDHATRETLAHLQQGSTQPSDSGELGGAVRAVAVVATIPPDQLERRVRVARDSTQLTHGDPQVVDVAEWLVRVSTLIENGETFAEAFHKASLNLPPVLQLANKVTQAASDDLSSLRMVGKDLGLNCGLDAALPLALGLCLRFENDPVKAVVTNALLGGDSAARGMLIGWLLGARHGISHWPESWFDNLHAARA